LIVKFPISSV